MLLPKDLRKLLGTQPVGKGARCGVLEQPLGFRRHDQPRINS